MVAPSHHAGTNWHYRCIELTEGFPDEHGEGTVMNKSIGDWLSSGIRFVLLRGSGWKSRKRLVAGCYRREWLDPISGHWYGTRKAVEIIERQMLTQYEHTGTTHRQYSLHC